MRETAELLAEAKWDEALVRLCHLANPAALNRWENQRNARAFKKQVGAFLTQLTECANLEPGEVDAAPLALMRALDRALVSERGARRFSGTPFVIEGSTYWLVPRCCVFEGLPRLRHQAGSLAHWLPHHVLLHGKVGDIAVQPVVATGTLADSLEALLRKRPATLKVWIGHFGDDCQVVWDKAANPAGRWRALSFNDADRRLASLQQSLNAARDAGAQVIVLPELSIDPSMRDEVIQWLSGLDSGDRPLLLVQGSFHEQLADGWFNTAPLVDGCALDVLMVHRKLRVFGGVEGPDGADLAEAIDIGRVMHLLVTAAGTFGVLICKDFLDADADVATLLQRAPVDWPLVPSYGNETTRKAHHEAAASAAIVTVGCQAVVANIRDLGVSAGVTPLPGFAFCLKSKSVKEVAADGGMVVLHITGEPDDPGHKPALVRVK